MIPLTAVMPIRLDCPERLANAMITTKYLLDVLHVRQVIMVETDTSPKLLGSIVHPRLRWLYVQTDPTDIGFHRSHAFNTAIPWVETPIYAAWDTDGLVQPADVYRGVDLILKNELQMCVPHDCTLFLHKHSTYASEILAGNWPTNPKEQAPEKCELNAGLVTFLSTKYFRHIRGMSELFRAYGDEDNELIRRVDKLGGRVRRLNGNALHLWHPNARYNNPGAKDEIPGKMRELARLKEMSGDGMRAYMGITDIPGEFTQKRKLIGGASQFNYCLPANYTSREKPEYFVDAPQQMVWQPDVYPLALKLATALGLTVIIDIGCGRAAKLAELYRLQPQLTYIGIDFGANIQWCSAHHNFGKWLDMDMEQPQTLLELTPGLLSKSLIICADVIEHLVNPLHVLNFIKQLLNSGAAIAMVSTPEREKLYDGLQLGPPSNVCHVREWTIQELNNLLVKCELAPTVLGLTRSNDQSDKLATSLAIMSKPLLGPKIKELATIA